MVRDRMNIKIEREYEPLLRDITNSLGFSNITSWLKAIASGNLLVYPVSGLPLIPCSIPEQTVLIRAVTSLVEKGGVNDARMAATSIQKAFELSDGTHKELDRLCGCQQEWVQQVDEYLKQNQPFQLTYHQHIYTCLYADRWVGGTDEKRIYLRAWVEETDRSSGIDLLRHNRIFRLDEAEVFVQPVPEKAWRYEGVDQIPITLRFDSRFKYTAKPFDEPELVEVVEADGRTWLQVTRHCWSVFWLLQDIRRYGDRCVVVAPDAVRQAVIDELQRSIDLYKGQ